MDQLWFALVLFFIRTALGNEGRDFIFTNVQIFHTNDSLDHLLITPTTNRTTNVTVIAPGYPDLLNTTITVQPGEFNFLTIHEHLAMNYGSYVDSKGIYVSSSDNIHLVGVVKETWKTSGSSYDSFLVRPTDQLGYEYFAIGYEIMKNIAASTFAVVASENDTFVKVTLATAVDVMVTFQSSTFKGGDVIEVTLKQYDVLQVQSRSDLTGSHVFSNKPIAVFSGMNRTTVEFTGCMSTLVDQLPPVSVWGKEYVAVPVPRRQKGDIFRIIARWSQTAVYVQGMEPVLLKDPGSWKELYLENVTLIKANKPVEIGQFAVSLISALKNSEDGDPALVVLSPMEAVLASFIFSVVPWSRTFFVVIVIEESEVDGLLLDGQSVNASVESVEGSPYAAVTLEVYSTGTSKTLTHAQNKPFVAYLHTVSKCTGMVNSLGSAHATFYQECETSPGYPGDGVDNDCDGQVDEERCCVNRPAADVDGDMVNGEDCAAPNSEDFRNSSYFVCCHDDGSLYFCKENIRNTQLYYIDDIRRHTSNTTSGHAQSKMGCFMKCGIHVDCWGINFKPTFSNNSNCELLFGDIIENNTGDHWSHYVEDRTWSEYIEI